MDQDAPKNLPHLAPNDSLLNQVQNVAVHEKSQDTSFLAQVTGNPFFTAVSAILAEHAMAGHY